MKYKAEVALGDGRTLLLRSLCANDARDALCMLKKTAGETDFMMRYEDEWSITEQEEREALARAEHAPKALMLGAFVDGKLVGIANFRPVHPGDRARHRAGMGVCVLRSHWSMGIGTALMRAAIAAAKTTALEYLELSVAGKNARAKAMYDKFGFIQYGRQTRAMKYRDGRYDDLILMQLDLREKA